MSKKVNPRRRPCTEADIIKAKRDAVEQGVKLAIGLMLYVLVDKEGMKKLQLQRIANEVNDISESVKQGYVNLADIRTMLKEEYDVTF